MKSFLRSSRREEALTSFRVPSSPFRVSRMSLLTSAATIFIALLLLPNLLCAQESKTKIRFEAVDIFVNSGAKPLAAYQLEFRVEKGDAKIVGVEGGSHVAFREPPFYDPKAIQQERVILAAFNTSNGNKLPKHKTRVATIHLQISGSKEPKFSVKLKTAANADGKKISAEATFETKEK